MVQLIRELYPFNRSITGAGLRATIAHLNQFIPLEATEVPSGTQVFDWVVPDEWSIEDAYLEHASGRRFACFSDSNLHVVNYSEPVDTEMTLAELTPYLHSLPDHPDWIPYKTSYYTRAWGFCVTDRVLRTLPEGRYRAVIRSQIKPGSLTLAQHVHRGATDDEVLVFAHDCHPSLANDNLSGIAVAVQLARYLATQSTRYSYRFVFAPATIGSISWLALNQANLKHIRYGLVLSLLGNDAPLHYKRSRRSDHLIDRAAEHILKSHNPGAQIMDFSPWGYDERQFCSPGINLPVGALSRSPDALLTENHTSADTPDSIRPESLSEALLACLRIFETLENDRRYENLQPKGEPQLGRRGLYKSSGGYYSSVPDAQMALLWMLNQSDGTASVLDIAERSGIPFSVLARAAADLEAVDLIRAQER